MATTLHLAQNEPAPNRNRQAVTVAAHGRGAFGRRILDLLGAGPVVDVLSWDDVDAAFAADAAMVVLVLWRADPELCERADELAYTVGRPWFPVVVEHPVIRVGPLVSPGRGPCFSCYAKRRIQHDDQYSTTRRLRVAYTADPGLGPEGFLPHHVRLAAGVAGRMAMAVVGASPSPGPGDVVTVRLLRTGVTADSVVACHGCRRCAPTPPRRDLRTVLERLSSFDRPEVSGATR